MLKALPIALILLILIFHLETFAQQQPTLLAPGIISNGGAFGFTLSPDGRSAFWVSSGGKRDTLIIMHAQLLRGAWQKPTAASFSGNYAWKDIDPMFSPDGKTVFFQSNRPVPGKPDRKGFDIWAVTQTRNGWSAPYHLGDSVNTDASESYASAATNANLYFMKDNPDGIGSSDIYVTRFLNGTYWKPENVGLPINTPFRESNPFIAPDESYLLYFSSDSTGLGEVDLYISFRNSNGWSTPVNLGQPVNTADAEFCPFYHKKEKRLYFSRQIKGTDRFIENIYFYDINLENYRPRQ